MSRGPGSLQREVLTAVPLGEPLSEDKLRWTLATQAGAVDDGGQVPLPKGRISKAFEQSFSRAVKRLIEDRRLIRTTRRLETVAEFLELYPFKTRLLHLRRLREALLPSLARYLGSEGKGRFSSADIEKFVSFDSVAAEEWLRLDSQLLGLELVTTDDSRELVFSIRAKGRALFAAGSKLSASDSLVSLLRRAERVFNDPADAAVISQLLELYYRCFDRNLLRHAQLKGQLHKAVDLSIRQSPRLHEHAKQFLLQANPAMVTALPGYRPAPPRAPTGSDIDTFIDLTPDVTFPEVLNRLVDRDVYRVFSVLERPNGSHQ